MKKMHLVALFALGVAALGCEEQGKKVEAVPSASAATPPPATASVAAPLPNAAPQAEKPLPAVTKSGTKLTWFGHAAFRIDTPSGKVILIDPWISNPKNPTGKDDVGKIDKADLILVTHGHFDHVGDAVAIAKKTKAKLVSTFDLGKALVTFAGYPKEQVGFDTQGNFGGTIPVLDGEANITFVPAVHSSAIDDAKGEPHDAGNPGGFVVAIKNGPAIYHTGDTDLFGDMALVGQHQPITVMLTAIGDHFVMGPEHAAEAVKLVRPAIAIPMHYGTFPVLTGTPEAFTAAVKQRSAGTDVRTLKPHDVVEL